MRIYVLAGDKSETISREIIKRSNTITVSYNSNLTEGLTEIELSNDVDKIVLFDSAYINGNRMYEFGEVFKAVENFASASCEVLAITTNNIIQNKFIEVLYSTENCRCEKVEKVRGSDLIDLIMNKQKVVKVESVNLNEQSLDNELSPTEIRSVQVPEQKPVSVVEKTETSGVLKAEPKKFEEPVVEVKPVVPEPEEQEVKPVEEVVIPKRKSTKSFFKGKGNKKSLVDYFISTKTIMVTGNSNSGVTSTACEIFNTCCKEGISSVLIDFDLNTFGTTMYFSNLDSTVSNNIEKMGIVHALNNISIIEDYCHTVNAYGKILGCSSEVYCKHILGDSDLSSKLIDILCALSSEFKAVILHIPFTILEKNIDIVNHVDSVLYCTNSTINGLYSVRNNLCVHDTMSSVYVRKLSLLHRKIKYVICNYDETNQSNVTPDNMLNYLEDLSQTSDYCKPIAGVIEHVKGFDKFDVCKFLQSNSKADLYIDLIVNGVFI